MLCGLPQVSAQCLPIVLLPLLFLSLGDSGRESNTGVNLLVGLGLLIFDWLVFIEPRLDTVITLGAAAVKNPEQVKNNILL